MIALGLVAPAASATAGETSPAEHGHYQAPPAIRIFRFSAYSTMKARWKKKATVDTLVLTTEGGVLLGDRGQLQRQVTVPASPEATGPSPLAWVPFAQVTVKKVLPKGRLELEIESETAEAKVKRNGKLPFNPGQKVLLQIDRVMN